MGRGSSLSHEILAICFLNSSACNFAIDDATIMLSSYTHSRNVVRSSWPGFTESKTDHLNYSLLYSNKPDWYLMTAIRSFPLDHFGYFRFHNTSLMMIGCYALVSDFWYCLAFEHSEAVKFHCRRVEIEKESLLNCWYYYGLLVQWQYH